MDVVTIVVQLLGIVAAVAPGVLAALSGQRSDADALEHAEQAVRRLHPRPAATAIDRVAEELRTARGDEPTGRTPITGPDR
jgi:hypothetical protein